MRLLTVTAALLTVCANVAFAEEVRLSLLFLGDNGHHRPGDRAAQLIPVLAERGIDVKYTDDVGALSLETLNQFDGLIIYANTERITPEQEQALLDYVAAGHGFIPLHCASYCFLNSDKYVQLVGAQFQRHGTGEFRTVLAEQQHPIMQGFGGFGSWDETYIHTRHNEQDRTVLEYRAEGDQAQGRDREPWTWVRTHDKGRVFYTAWGHDQRTWGHPGFQNLMERGIRWACGGDPSVVPGYHEREPFTAQEMTPLRTDVAPFEYVNVGAKIPNYTPGAQWGTQGRPFNMMQTPLPPEESIKHYVTPVGFELQLYASEPDLGGKPIAMTWDERGRLWVCETHDYPNELQRSGEGRDRIRICEDTDGDGKADKFTVFAETLSIPTAITCSYGGVIVQNGTETIFLKDTDGDDQADVRETLITGWALGDTHGGVSNFQYGLDNWIYAMQGYNNSTPVINGERQQSFRQGFFRFRLAPPESVAHAARVRGDDDAADGTRATCPTVVELEFLRSTDNNTWGFGMSEEGIIFGSTANRNPSVYLSIPNRYYERVRGWGPEQLRMISDTYLFKAITDKVRQVDQFGGYTAGAGHALYTARTYPETWWNRTAFVCEPTGHIVGTFAITADGADFHSTSPCNLIASDDEWASPIMAEVGPDGNVWVIDWYNFIVQHNPTPQGFRTGRGNAYESDLRDKKHGRIYRVAYRGKQSGESREQSENLGDATPGQLVSGLKNPTMLCRKHAQRLLVERGETDVVPALIEQVNDQSTDTIGLNVGAIHALWTLKGLGALDKAEGEAFNAAVAALKHPSAGVRRNAVQVLPFDVGSLKALLESGVANDKDPQVRLAYLLALSDMPDGEGIGTAVGSPTMDDAFVRDRWLRDAATSAAAVHALPYFEHLVRVWEFPCAPGTSADAAYWPIVQRAAEHVARGRSSAEDVNKLISLMQRGGGLFAQSVLAGLSAGWPRGHTVALTPESEKSLLALLEIVPAGSKGQLIRLASLWGSKELEKHAGEIAAALLASASDAGASTRERVAAVQQLVGFQPADAEVVTKVLGLVTAQAAPELAEGLIASLSQSTADNVGPELIARVHSLTPAARDAAFRALLSRPETTVALLDAAEAGKASLTDLTLDQKQAMSNHPSRRIRERAVAMLKAGGGLPNADRQKVLEELLHLAERTGDAALGKEVFKKQCSKCHVHGTEGTRIGPDLTGMAVHPKHEMLTNLIDPSRSVEGNFRVYTVVTTDGIVLNGMLASETRTSIELIDTEAKRHAIPREDIEELVGSTKSLMPEGFEKQVTQDDIANLLEFLAQRGKYLPLDLRKVATTVSTRGMFYSEEAEAERLIFPDWTPKTFKDVPFVLVDPQGDRVANAVVLYGPIGTLTQRMPRSVTLPCNSPAKAVHLLSGVSGWGYPFSEEGSVTVIVRLHYADGETEDHELKNGVHFADYIRRVDVPGSEFAFRLRGQQIRYLSVQPQRSEVIKEVELVKGPDRTAPVVMAVTVETQ